MILLWELKDKSEKAMYYHYQDVHWAVKSKKPEPGENKNARVLWAMKEAKDRGKEYYDPNHKQEIQTREVNTCGLFT